MKLRIITLFILFTTSVICLKAQDEYKNFIEFKVTRGGGDGVGQTTGMTVSYARDIGKGLYIKPSYLIAQGGKNLAREFSQGEVEAFTERFGGDDNDNLQVSYIQYRSLGLGLQKSVNTNKRGSLNVMISGRATYFHNQTYNGHSDTEVFINFSSELLYGFQIELSYYHRVADHLQLFATGNYMTNPYLFNFGLGMSVGL